MIEQNEYKREIEFIKGQYEKKLRDVRAGTADDITEEIRLELLAIKDLAEYMDEGSKRRVLRRLARIDNILDMYKESI